MAEGLVAVTHARLRIPLEFTYCVDPDLLRWSKANGDTLLEVEQVEGTDDMWRCKGHGWLLMDTWLEFVRLCDCEWRVVLTRGCQCGGN